MRVSQILSFAGALFVASASAFALPDGTTPAHLTNGLTVNNPDAMLTGLGPIEGVLGSNTDSVIGAYKLLAAIPQGAQAVIDVIAQILGVDVGYARTKLGYPAGINTAPGTTVKKPAPPTLGAPPF